MGIETELPTQIRGRTEESVDCTRSGGTIPVCLPLPVPVQTLQSNRNLHVTLGMNFPPSSPNLNAFSMISGVLTKKKKKHKNYLLIGNNNYIIT